MSTLKFIVYLCMLPVLIPAFIVGVLASFALAGYGIGRDAVVSFAKR